ncbi:MAG: DUF3619 family protein [Burkholderiales bacterium]|nr:DUF3619 family protein [Burkholderiales bacterium]
MNDETDFAKKLTTYLDCGTAELRAGTAYRLQQARSQALARLSQPLPARESRLVHALAGGSTRKTGGSWRRSVGFGLCLVLLAAAVFGYQQWQFYQHTREIADLDVQILSSDLPIDAYLDRGFQSWLTRYEP